MKRVTLATIALSALAGSLLQTIAVASPPTPGPRGRGCSYSASSDPSPEAGDDAMTGQVNAGPMIGDAGGTLHCIIRVNVNSHAGGGIAADVACPADSNGMIVCGTTINYTSGEDDQDYMCMSYRKPDGGWLYWHPTEVNDPIDPTDDEPAHWTPNSNKPCSRATQISTGPIFDAIDALTCPEIAKHAGPGNGYFIDTEGDVFIDMNDNGDSEASYDADWAAEWVWDCPLYTFDPGNPDLLNGDGVVDYPGGPTLL